MAIIDHWAHDDARTLESVHEQLCGPGDDLDPDRRWTKMVRRLRDEVASGWLVLHRERLRDAAPGTLPVQPPRPSPRPSPTRPVTPDGELSFYELELVDECEGPLAGVRVEMSTPAGLRRVDTDGSGRARVDDVPAGWATARLVDVARVHEVLGRRDRRARRVAPLEEDDDTELSMTSAERSSEVSSSPTRSRAACDSSREPTSDGIRWRRALFLAAPLVKEWVDSSPGRRLRATYGEVANGTYLEALRRRIESSAPGAVVIAPAQPASWTVDVHQQQPSTWWGACIQDIHFWSALIAREAMAGKGGSRHAFAMFGGDGERPSNGGRTFFEDFLRASSLHRPT